MSSQELRSLRREVGDLREEVEDLRSELSRVRRSVSELRIGGGGYSDSRSDSRRAIEEESEDSYSVVSESASRAGPLVYQQPVAAVPAGPSTSLPVSTGSLAGPPSSSGSGRKAVLNWDERLAIAEDIGRFVERCLSGTHRGNSGRERNPLQSRYWVVIRDHAGQIYSPVKVFTLWTRAKDLVKKGHDCGDSIFFGIPTEQEGKRAVEVAGLSWPAFFEK